MKLQSLKPLNNALILSVTGLLVFLIHAFVAPGQDYFDCYTWLVTDPEKLVELFGYPLTYNPPWLAPMLAPFITMPGRAGFVLFLAVTVALFLAAAYLLHENTFDIRIAILLVSSQLFWILWWGQIEAMVVLGIALGWSAFQGKSWKRMTVALLLAALKPQLSLLPMIYLWWNSGKDRWKSLAALGIVVLFSIVIYGPWPVWLMENVVKISQATQYHTWNSSLGLIALPLLAPAVLVPLRPYQRMVALTATGLLISPYMPYYSTIPLLAFALPGWSIVFSLLGYFASVLGTTLAWNGMVLFPICVLAWLYIPKLPLPQWASRWLGAVEKKPARTQ